MRWESEPRASRVIWFSEGSTRHSPRTKGSGDIVLDSSTGLVTTTLEYQVTVN